ncbi:VOC family protein [Tundrisphaera lichenicola]|uniref:VOC family protein n=1 Tax=Tundrisphaera lichenicola TaxID=2029860 RepID=UPI003EB85DFC
MSRIEHVAIFAADPAALKDFYEEVFGLRVILDNGRGTPPGYFLADNAGFAVEIIGRPEGSPVVDQRYSSHIAFLVEDVLATRSELEARGLVFENETFVDNDSMTTAFFRDPEGNRLQIVRRKKPLGG